MRPQPGTSLGGRYALEERLAGGGMGAVWRGTDSVLGRDVAVKVMSEELSGEPSFLQRFRAEARSAASLSHPGVAQVFDYGEEDGSPYLVMELVPGRPLSAMLAQEGPLGVDRTLDLMGQAGLALDAAHAAGVIHRDVKPGNLLVTPDGTVKVTDFGIARAADAAPLTKTGTVMGTAQYLSPETASGHPATTASDVYSLGVVAYECLTGAPPFRGDNPVALAMAHVRDPVPPMPDTVPPPVRELVLQSLEKNPAMRPASAGEFGRRAYALRSDGAATVPVPAGTAVMAGAPATHRLDGPGQHAAGAGHPRRREHSLDTLPRPVLAAIVLLGLLLGGLLLSAAFDSSGERSSAQDKPAREQAGDPSKKPSPPQKRTAKKPSRPTGIQIVSANYEGRDYREVQRRLEAEDLVVELKPEEDDETAPFTVIEVKPEEFLYPGDTVEVKYAVPKRDKGKGQGNSDPGNSKDNRGQGSGRGDQGDD